MSLTAGPSGPAQLAVRIVAVPAVREKIASFPIVPARRAAQRGQAGVQVRPALFTIGGTDWSSVSQGNKIQVSWLTSVMKLSTRGRPAGLA